MISGSEARSVGVGYTLVRVLTNADWTDYHSLRRSVLWDARGRTGYEENRSDDRAAQNHPLLLKLHGQSIGTTRLDDFGNRTAVVRTVAIAPGLQRQGHGRQLSALVEAYARRRGILTLFVNAAQDAVGWYEKLGWEKCIWSSEVLNADSEHVQMRKALPVAVMSDKSGQLQRRSAFETSEVCAFRAAICRQILDDLPEWFGIPDAKAAFVAGSDSLPMFAARIDGEPVGFVSLKRHTDFAAEVYVIGVARRHHRQGIGRALMDASVQWAISQGLAFLTVKTLAASNPDVNYAATRRFYEAVGFQPIEVFPTLWDARNPCVLMVMPV
jgi:ribosomal protein S18 acetylase RimI-like enzyme